MGLSLETRLIRRSLVPPFSSVFGSSSHVALHRRVVVQQREKRETRENGRADKFNPLSAERDTRWAVLYTVQRDTSPYSSALLSSLILKASHGMMTANPSFHGPRRTTLTENPMTHTNGRLFFFSFYYYQQHSSLVFICTTWKTSPDVYSFPPPGGSSLYTAELGPD